MYIHVLGLYILSWTGDGIASLCSAQLRKAGTVGWLVGLFWIVGKRMGWDAVELGMLGAV